MNGLNTLNLVQVSGGVNIKQGDSKSVLEYELGYNDGSSFMSDLGLSGKSAQINLYNRIKETRWSTSSTVVDNRVKFTIDAALGLGVYTVDITVDGHVFPSDRSALIRVHEGYQSYMDGKSAAVAVATARNIANEGIRLAVLDGLSNLKGPQGDRGPQGPKGDKGDRGDTGAMGPRGYKGDTGNTGPQGERGLTGAIGPRGPKGADGTVSFESLTDAQRAMLRVPIVNDLTTGGVDKALSAEQGKVLFTYADDGKKSIADAIIGKGGSATKDDTFKDLAAKIAGIKTGYGVGDVIPEENVKVLKKLVGEPEKVWEFDVNDDVYSICTGVDNSVFCCTVKGLYKISTQGKAIWSYSKDNIYFDVATDINGAAYVCKSGEILIFPANFTNGENPKVIKAEGRNPTSIDVNLGEIFYSFDKRVIKISPEGQKIWEFTGHTDEVSSVAVSPDGSIYSGGFDKRVIKISPEGQKIWEFIGHTNWVRSVAVSPDGSIYSGGRDAKVLKIFDGHYAISYEVIK